MNSHLSFSREDLRICMDVVKSIARGKGVSRDPTAVAQIMTTVARYYSRALHEPSALRAAALSELEGNSFAEGAPWRVTDQAEAS